MLPLAAKGGLGSEARGALAAEPAFDCGTGACVGTEHQLSCKCEYVLYRLYPWRPRNIARSATEVVRKIFDIRRVL